MKQIKLNNISFWYLGLAALTGLFYFSFAIWLPNISLNFKFLFSSNFNASQKLKFFWSTFGYFCTGFTLFSQIIIILTAILIGLNITLLVYYIKHRAKCLRSAGLSVGAVIISIIGIGCSSCGSVILSSLIGFGATSSVLGILPFGGKELGILSILILIFSIILIYKKIKTPFVCAASSKK